MKLACQFCDDGSAYNALKSFPDEYLDDNAWSVINDMAPKINDTFIHCKLFNEEIDCTKLFFPRISERGLCMTFNAFNVHEMFTNEYVCER